MGRGTIYCCVPSCLSSRVSSVHNKTVFQKDREAITFHRFPKNPERHAVWARKCFVQEIDGYYITHDNSSKRNAYVCSKHFTSDDFTETFLYGELLKYSSKKILKITAVPSLDLPDHTTPSHLKKPPIKSESDYPTHQKQLIITKSHSCPSDKSPISKKLRKLREEGQKRIAQLIKENEEIFKCSIHKVNSPACSIENCVLRPKRRKKAAYDNNNSAVNSLEDQTYCVDFGDEIESDTYTENIITLEEAHAESELYDSVANNNSSNSLSESLTCLETFKEEVVDEDSKQFVEEENSSSGNGLVKDNPSHVNDIQVLQVDKERKFLLKYCGKPTASNPNHYIVDGADFINIITEPHHGAAKQTSKRTKSAAESHHQTPGGKRLKITTREQPGNELQLNEDSSKPNNAVDVSEQFNFNTRNTSQYNLPKQKDNSAAKHFTSSSKGDLLVRQLDLSRTALCNVHNVVACDMCMTNSIVGSNYVIESVKSEKCDFQTVPNSSNNKLGGGNSLIHLQVDDKIGNKQCKSLSDKRSAFQSGGGGNAAILSNPSGNYGSSYRLIRPKTNHPPPQPNPSCSNETAAVHHLVKGKSSNNLDRLKKIDQLITENNILISNLSFDSGKRKPGGGEGKYPLKALGAVQSADAGGTNNNTNNKENTVQFSPSSCSVSRFKTSVPPPLVPIGSGTLGQYEQTILEQTNVIQKLVDRVNKLEEENERLKRVELENEYLKTLLNEQGDRSLVNRDNSSAQNSLAHLGQQKKPVNEEQQETYQRESSTNLTEEHHNSRQNTTLLGGQQKRPITEQETYREQNPNQQDSAGNEQEKQHSVHRGINSIDKQRQGKHVIRNQQQPKNLPQNCTPSQQEVVSAQEVVHEQEKTAQGGFRNKTVEVAFSQEVVRELESTEQGGEKIVEAISDQHDKQGKVVILMQKVRDALLSRKTQSFREDIKDAVSRRGKGNRTHQYSGGLEENSGQSCGQHQQGKNETQKGLKRQERVEDSSSIDCIEINEDIEQSTKKNKLEEKVEHMNVSENSGNDHNQRETSREEKKSDQVNVDDDRLKSEFHKSPKTHALLEIRTEIASEYSKIVEEILPYSSSECKEIARSNHKERSDNRNSVAINARQKGVDKFNADKSNETLPYEESSNLQRTNTNELTSDENDELNETIDESIDGDDLNQSIDDESPSNIGEHIGDTVENEQLSGGNGRHHIVENDQVLCEVDRNIEVLSEGESNTNECNVIHADCNTYVIHEELSQVDSNHILESHQIDGEIDSSNIIESHVIDGELDSSNIIESHVIDGELDSSNIIESCFIIWPL
uniref:THAP-type domain-containing protein n=1 Tax=Cacopsylla melanoneura TaxID=428564 RepID=A0A8D8PYP3_9HEMI